MRAAIYARISRDSDGQGAGVERQEADCLALVEREGWSVVKVYTDNSVSAYSGKQRPAWTRLLADAGAGAFDVLVAWHDDRLWRNVTEQQAVSAMLGECGVSLIATPSRTYRTDSVDDDFLGGLQALLAQHESARSGVRKRRQKLQLAEQGRDGGGWRAFGYQADRMTVDPTEARHLREAYDYLIAGGSIMGLCDRWNAAGVTTSKGKPWVPTVAKRLMLNPRLAGLRVHQGEVVGRARWDPIFTTAEHERLAAVLRSRERTRSGPMRSYLLTGGIAVCGRCGADLHAQRRPNGRASYKCYQTSGAYKGCGGIAVVADKLESYVAGAVVEVLCSGGLERAIAAAAGDDERRAAQADELRDVERRLQEVEVAHFVDGVLTRKGYLAARERLTGVVEALRRTLEDDSRLGVLTGLPSTVEALEARWDEAGVGWRRTLVAATVARVTVLPANGRRLFHAERVAVEWLI